MEPSSILVIGAGGVLGQAIVRILRARGADVVAAYRTERAGVEEALAALGARPLQLDITDTAALREALGRAGAAIFTPILTTSQDAASLLCDDQRAVFFSSNNVAIDPAADVYARLLAAEKAVLGAAPGAVILRPTMIYGYPGDGNLSRLINFMRRSPIVPLPGSGAALQQPVYFGDLARAAAGAVLGDVADARVCAVAGPEPVTGRALFEAVARAAGARPLLVPAPLSPIAPLLKFCEGLGVKLPIKAAQLARAAKDKTPQGDAPVIVTGTALDQGLRALVEALDARRRGA